MPGIYLLAILVSAAGIATIDARWKLAAWRAPWRTAASVAIGTIFFLLWDAVGITTGVFLKGDSSLFIGIDVAPELPLEEPFFLLFLCYLALIVWSAAQRLPRLRRTTEQSPPRAAASGPSAHAGREHGS